MKLTEGTHAPCHKAADITYGNTSKSIWQIEEKCLRWEQWRNHPFGMSPKHSNRFLYLLATITLTIPDTYADYSSEVLIPQIDGEWWQVAGNPDLGEYTTPNQEPVDFCVWQAADGTWQLWSCIRDTGCGGNTRLLHGWEGKNLTDANWKPIGIRMEGKEEFGESIGGLQAPHVIHQDGVYHMFYGDWNNICVTVSKDGKNFNREVQESGKTALFNEGANEHARDAMLLKIKEKWYCYYTAHSKRSPEENQRGVTYCRTSDDLRNWSESLVVAEGSDHSTGPYCTECPHVVYHQPSNCYYLFNTQRYGSRNISTVFRSKDPLNFGINDFSKEVTRLEIAAPEIIFHQGQYYIAALNPNLDGIRIAKLKWVPKE